MPTECAGPVNRVLLHSSHQPGRSTNGCILCSVDTLHPSNSLPLGIDEQGLDGYCCSWICFQLCDNRFASNGSWNPGDLCRDSDVLCCLSDLFGYPIERRGLGNGLRLRWLVFNSGRFMANRFGLGALILLEGLFFGGLL